MRARTTGLTLAGVLCAIGACGIVACGSGSGSRGAAAGDRDCEGTRWVASWTASPAGVDGTVFNDQTLRQIVQPHYGGSRLRLRLSNRFGNRPVTFSSVTLAKPRSKRGVDDSGLRRVPFDGRRSVTVAPGEDVVSDAVRFPLAAFENVAVSAAVEGASGPATTHFVANQTSFVTAPGAGDHTADRTGQAFVGRSTSWYFLSGIDVVAPARTGVLVAFGDSVIDGGGSGLDANGRYPDRLAAELHAGGAEMAVVNQGISGNRLIAAGPTQPAAIDRVERDVLSVPGVTDVVIHLGDNDIFAPPFHGAAPVQEALAQLAGRLESAGLNVIVGTLSPVGGETPYEASRRQVNEWIRSSRVGSSIVDFDAALRGPSGYLKPDYDSGDHIHPNSTGYAAMTRSLRRSQLSGRRCG